MVILKLLSETCLKRLSLYYCRNNVMKIHPPPQRLWCHNRERETNLELKYLNLKSIKTKRWGKKITKNWQIRDIRGPNFLASQQEFVKKKRQQRKWPKRKHKTLSKQSRTQTSDRKTSEGWMNWNYTWEWPWEITGCPGYWEHCDSFYGRPRPLELNKTVMVAPI